MAATSRGGEKGRIDGASLDSLVGTRTSQRDIYASTLSASLLRPRCTTPANEQPTLSLSLSLTQTHTYIHTLSLSLSLDPTALSTHEPDTHVHTLAL